MSFQPFIPKSSAKLSLGDYCVLKRDDGLFVPLIFLSKAGHLRSTFYGALLNHAAPVPMLSDSGPDFKVFFAAHLPVKVFAENNAPIVGNVAARLDRADVGRILEEMKEKVKVWGFRTPLKYANLINV